MLNPSTTTHEDGASIARFRETMLTLCADVEASRQVIPHSDLLARCDFRPLTIQQQGFDLPIERQ